MKRFITTLAIATIVLAGCTDKKAEKDDTTATEVAQEVTTQEAATPKVDSEAAKSLITQLYTDLYVNEISNDKRAGFLGDKLNAKLNEMDGEMALIDYDPFIDAQDYDAKSVQSSLTITELSDGLFQVEVEPLKGYKKTLRLTLGLENGALKILDIPSDPNISVLK